MGLETGAFTKALNSISDTLNNSKIANNKYFNWKDAGFVGSVGLGAGAGYVASDGNFEQTVNGGIFGVTAGALARHGMSGYSKGLEKLMVNSNASNLEMSLAQKFTTGKMGTAKTLGLLGTVGAVGGGIGGALGETTGAGTTATGGAIEGGALAMMAGSLASIVGHRGGGVNRLLGGGGVGLAAGIAGAAYGGYEGLEAEDGGFQKMLIKGAVYGKLAKTASMLGMERYGSTALNKIPKSFG
jgi:hypothetical protein